MQAHLGGLIQFASQDTTKAVLSGHVYRKQLAKYGEWVNPEYPYRSSDPIMTLDEAWGNKIVENFNANTLGSPVPIPLNHTNEVQANTGRVESLESVPGDGLYGNLRIDDEDTIEKLDKGIIFDVSISFDWNHVRTDNNKSYGPTLLHVALVNNPYLIEMNTFEKIGPALSKLEEAFKPVGLFLASKDVMMLSRTKMKELSAMATATVKNDKEFPVTVTFIDDGEGKEVTIASGEDIEVPEDVAEEVATQIADATETADAEDLTDESDEGDEGDEGETQVDDVEDAAAELSRLRLENTELQLSRDFDSLLAEGKVIPAQKDKVLALAKLSQGIQLSTGVDTKTNVADVVLDILRSGKQQFSTDESGSSKADEADDTTDQSNEDKKPSELLSEEDLAGLQATGVTPEQMDKMAAENPLYAKALVELSK